MYLDDTLNKNFRLKYLYLSFNGSYFDISYIVCFSTVGYLSYKSYQSYFI